MLLCVNHQLGDGGHANALYLGQLDRFEKSSDALVSLVCFSARRRSAPHMAFLSEIPFNGSFLLSSIQSFIVYVPKYPRPIFLRSVNHGFLCAQTAHAPFFLFLYSQITKIQLSESSYCLLSAVYLYLHTRAFLGCLPVPVLPRDSLS